MSMLVFPEKKGADLSEYVDALVYQIKSLALVAEMGSAKDLYDRLQASSLDLRRGTLFQNARETDRLPGDSVLPSNAT